MKLISVLAGAAALSLMSISMTLADDYVAGAVKSAMVSDKQILTDSKGMTLYIWDKDAVGVSNCYEKCAIAWPPLLAAADATAEGDFTLVDRTDGTKIWAYKGWPLYLWAKDTKPGDTTGDGVGGTWHTALE